VDVERVDRSLPFIELAEYYFSPDETAWFRRQCREVGAVRFIELWTLKESFLKALGLGLSGSLEGVSFRFDEPARITATGPWMAHEPEWYFGLFEPDFNVRLAVTFRSVVPPSLSVREDGEQKLLQPIRASW
jgi:4'-phosphopantetheinyl transferase